MSRSKKRISGVGLMAAGAFAARDEDGTWRIDLGAVSARLSQYLEEAHKKGVYSPAGLFLCLGVTREVFALWRQGYVCAADKHDANTLPNEALIECADIAMLHIERYWEECEKSGVQTKMVKMMEQSGALGTKPEQAAVPEFELGGLGKYSR